MQTLQKSYNMYKLIHICNTLSTVTLTIHWCMLDQTAWHIFTNFWHTVVASTLYQDWVSGTTDMEFHHHNPFVTSPFLLWDMYYVYLLRNLICQHSSRELQAVKLWHLPCTWWIKALVRTKLLHDWLADEWKSGS